MNTKALYFILIFALLLSIAGTTLSILEYFSKSDETTKTLKSTILKSFPPYEAEKIIIVNTNVNNTVKSPTIQINSELNEATSNVYDLKIDKKSIVSNQTKSTFNVKNGIFNGYINKDINNTTLINGLSTDDIYLYIPTMNSTNIVNNMTFGGIVKKGNAVITIDDNNNYSVYIAILYGKPDNVKLVNEIIFFSVEIVKNNATVSKQFYDYSPDFIYVMMNLIDTTAKPFVNIYIALTESLASASLDLLNGLSFELATFSVSNSNEKRFTFGILYGSLDFKFNIKSDISNYIVQTTTNSNTTGSINLGNIDNACNQFNGFCRYKVVKFNFIKTSDNNNIDLTIFGYRYY